jgi:hypothetical protein
MNRICAFCGRTFAAKRVSARFCSSSCRGKQSKRRKRLAAVGAAGQDGAVPVSAVPDLSPREPSPLVEITERALSEAGQLDTPIGLIAMVIATRMGQDSMLDNAAGLVALSKELDRLLAIALQGSEPPDALDDLERRRRLKAAKAGS